MPGTINTETITLNDGNKIPIVGYGTYSIKDTDTLIHALKSGFRHLDTALAYDNEVPVGKAVRESGIPREEIYVVTKLTEKDHRDPAAALEKSLKNLGLDYVDLYLIHWPVPLNQDGSVDQGWNHVKTWELLQKLPKSKVRSIGVSNYAVAALEELLNAPTTTVVPSVNQVELHPYLAQDKLRDYSIKKNIALAAYCPLGQNSALLYDPLVEELAKKYEVDAAQIALSWGVARGYIVLTRSKNLKRIESNIKIVQLSKEDEEKLSGLSISKPQRTIIPGFAPNIFTDDEFRVKG